MAKLPFEATTEANEIKLSSVSPIGCGQQGAPDGASSSSSRWLVACSVETRLLEPIFIPMGGPNAYA
jgi:hypothetical protein